MKTLVLTMAFSACTAAAVAGEIVNLNDLAVRDGDGNIVVFGTEGAWGGGSATKECVFDGDTSTFFDPPGAVCWAGIELQKPMVVTKIRYFGRSGWPHRMRGCEFQGASQADFSDATTFYVAAPESSWDCSYWLETKTMVPSVPCKYLRIVSPGGYSGEQATFAGNAAEIEFFGYDPEDAGFVAPASPPAVSTNLGMEMNRMMVVTVSSLEDAQVQVQRRGSNGEWAEHHPQADSAEGGTFRFWDRLGGPCGYRFRYVLGTALSEWTLVELAPARNALLGEWIGPTGTYANGRTGALAFDGDIESFVDGNYSDGFWMGLDLGENRMVHGMRYVPRSDQTGRMLGGMFQIADNPEFENATTIHTIQSTPAANTITDVPLAEPVSSRYVRYIAPNGGWGNVAEVEFYTDWTPEVTPLDVSETTPSAETEMKSSVSWSNPAEGYYEKVVVFRGDASDGPWTEIAELDGSLTSYVDTAAKMNTRYFYRLAYRNYDNGSALTGGMSDVASAVRAMRLERDWADLSQLKSGVIPIHEGSYWGDGSSNDLKPFDGDTATFCDLSDGGGAVGVDLGARSRFVVTSCRIFPRVDRPDRMDGCRLYGANELPGTSGWSHDNPITEPFVVTAAEYITVKCTTDQVYRYVYLANTDKTGDAAFFGNVAELELYGIDTTPVGIMVLVR